MAVDDWYTICGTAHTDWSAFVAVELLLAAVGTATYVHLLGLPPVGSKGKED